MTAKSPNDQDNKHPESDGAAPHLSWADRLKRLKDGIDRVFNMSACPEDMSGFFESLNREQQEKYLGQYIGFIRPNGSGQIWGRISLIERDYSLKSALHVEEVVFDEQGRISTTGGTVRVELDEIRVGPLTPEQFHDQFAKPLITTWEERVNGIEDGRKKLEAANLNRYVVFTDHNDNLKSGLCVAVVSMFDKVSSDFLEYQLKIQAELPDSCNAVRLVSARNAGASFGTKKAAMDLISKENRKPVLSAGQAQRIRDRATKVRDIAEKILIQVAADRRMGCGDISRRVVAESYSRAENIHDELDRHIFMNRGEAK